MVNLRKEKIMKSVWFKKGEFERLIDAVDGGFNDQILDIIYDIYNRGDLE